MSTVTAILALVEAVLNEFPSFWNDFQNLLNNHPANPTNQSVAQQVTAGTQTAEDALHNTVLK